MYSTIQDIVIWLPTVERIGGWHDLIKIQIKNTFTHNNITV